MEKKRKYEKKNLGKFERIYPTEDVSDPYKKFVDFAEEVYQLSMGGKKVKK